eukprot:CAMPEP_0179407870 /NCGR_PEP_ID=MMETSP0799-20121207/1761_1 /TAXON_ID=46947 /ORGANISM="Geminigera cryophila, Strain CCMP2564" /LENGTH=118 /DNA_ID=CAMNT_0021179235 /DNA_START=357 /DNA_END=713 /DNA_ORIENTATION=+
MTQATKWPMKTLRGCPKGEAGAAYSNVDSAPNDPKDMKRCESLPLIKGVYIPEDTDTDDTDTDVGNLRPDNVVFAHASAAIAVMKIGTNTPINVVNVPWASRGGGGLPFCPRSFLRKV